MVNLWAQIISALTEENCFTVTFSNSVQQSMLHEITLSKISKVIII